MIQMTRINNIILKIFNENRKYDGLDLQWITHKPKNNQDLERMWKNRFLIAPNKKFYRSR